ncbi:MAG: Abortive infection protein [Acidimicrobiales bacterium]|nr:Abortive infection protein [Acidimicrobiales bacterium]
MAATDLSEQAAAPEPRWGIGDAVAGWVIAYVAAAVLGSAILAAFGYRGDGAKSSKLPLTMIALTYVPLWVGFVGVPVYASLTKGAGLVRDFRARVSRIDVPIGLVVGVASQLLLVPLLSLPVVWLSGKTTQDLSAPARQLADKAGNRLGVLLLVLVVVIGAPIAEELFFRGLVLRSIERRFGVAWGIGVSAVVFGLTHFQALQLPALIAFGVVLGLLVHRTQRLGTSILAHMSFNAVTVILLLVERAR